MNSQVSWVVKVDKEFGITDEQFRVLKIAANTGKTMVWFDDLVINISHVKWMEKVKKAPETKLPELPAVSEETAQKNLERIRELRKKMRI